MGKSHGHTQAHGIVSPTYCSWQNMKTRCTNPSHAQFKDYGAKGITMCSRWEKFENFLADMGERPEGRTLDRIDNDKGYEPGNCRWATAKEQAREKRRNLTHNGITLSVTDWAAKLGIKQATLNARLNRHGWSVEKALTTPARNYAS